MMKHLFLAALIISSIEVFAQPFKGGTGDGHASAELKNIFISSVRSDDHLEASFFPNIMGTERNLMVRSSVPILEISIYDIEGKNVMRRVVQGNESINLSALCTGMYFIELRNKEKNRRGKITIIE